MKNREGKYIYDGGSDCGADITADPETLREINEKVREVMEEAPSDASVQLVLRRVGRGFKGLLKVYSSQQKFARGARGTGLGEVVNHLFGDVREQIRAWKQARYANAAGALGAGQEPWE